MRAAVVAVGIVLCGCPGGDDEPPPDAGPPPCALPVVGDPADDIEIELVVLGDGGALDTLDEASPMQAVSLFKPPQGGRVIFAGVRARNLDPCGVQLGGGLRDIASDKIVPEMRTVNLEPDGQGWAGSDPADITTFSNIAVCPNQWSDRDAFELPYELSVAVRERGTGRTAQSVVTAVPRCSADVSHCEQGDAACTPEQLVADCECICDVDYVLGMNCR
jgi:hypothetical protein